MRGCQQPNEGLSQWLSDSLCRRGDLEGAARAFDCAKRAESFGTVVGMGEDQLLRGDGRYLVRTNLHSIGPCRVLCAVGVPESWADADRFGRGWLLAACAADCLCQKLTLLVNS